RFLEESSSRSRLEKVMGNSLVTRMAWTNTSSNTTFFPIRESCSCCALRQSASPLKATVVNKVFIRKECDEQKGPLFLVVIDFCFYGNDEIPRCASRIPLAALPAQVHWV